MEETRANHQFQATPLKILEQTMTPRATSYTQPVIEIEQPPQMKALSMEKLMAYQISEKNNKEYEINY